MDTTNKYKVLYVSIGARPFSFIGNEKETKAIKYYKSISESSLNRISIMSCNERKYKTNFLHPDIIIITKR